MKSATFLHLSLGFVLFLIGGFCLNQMGQGQQQLGKMQAWPMNQGCSKILWDYDSGWVDIGQGDNKYFDHYLGGDASEYFVYMIGWRNSSNGINIQAYGTNGSDHQGALWDSLTNDHIRVYRETSDADWEKVRVRILKNQ